MRTFIAFALFLHVSFLGAQPIITSQPVDDVVCPGECGEFAVTAVGGGLTYQ